MPGDSRLIPIPEGMAGERIDAAMARMLGLSRSQCATMIDSGLVLLDGTIPSKSVRLRENQLLEVTFPAAEKKQAPSADLQVLYEDEDLIVINKPVGVAAHTGPGWDGPTVISSLEAAGVRVSTSGPTERQGIVQRLDVGTSGAMMVAKSELAYGRLKNEIGRAHV